MFSPVPPSTLGSIDRSIAGSPPAFFRRLFCVRSDSRASSRGVSRAALVLRMEPSADRAYGSLSAPRSSIVPPRAPRMSAHASDTADGRGSALRNAPATSSGCLCRNISRRASVRCSAALLPRAQADKSSRLLLRRFAVNDALGNVLCHWRHILSRICHVAGDGILQILLLQLIFV